MNHATTALTRASGTGGGGSGFVNASAFSPSIEDGNNAQRQGDGQVVIATIPPSLAVPTLADWSRLPLIALAA